MDKMQKETAPPHFETVLSELEILIEQMESGKMSLEDSLQAFERGVKLTRQCQEILNQAEQKIEILSQNSSEATLEKYQK